MRKVQGMPQSQTAALPRPQEEEETDKSKQAQIEQTYEKHSLHQFHHFSLWYFTDEVEDLCADRTYICYIVELHQN